MANYTIFSDLNIVADLQRADNTVLVDIHVISNGHFGVLESALLFHEAGSDYALFSNDGKSADRDSCKVTSQNCSCLDNRLTLDHDFFRTLNENLSANLVSLACDKKSVFIIVQGVLLHHHT